MTCQHSRVLHSHCAVNLWCKAVDQVYMVALQYVAAHHGQDTSTQLALKVSRFNDLSPLSLSCAQTDVLSTSIRFAMPTHGVRHHTMLNNSR